MANDSTANAILTSDGDGTLTAETALTFDGSDMTVGSDGRILLYGTSGGSGGGLIYQDSGGTGRYALQFPGSNIVTLSNRAANGVVQIRANNALAGASGEKVVATFEDDKVHFGTTVTKISGSSVSTGSFGRVEVDLGTNQIPFIDSNGGISGSNNFKYNGAGSFTMGDAAGLSIENNANDTDVKFQSRHGGSLRNFLYFDTSTGNMSVGRRGTTGATSSPQASLHVMDDLFVDGNIETEGDIIAKNYIVSSSTTYMTTSFSAGNTAFGDDSDDTHQFTGSLFVSGSLNVQKGVLQ